jgi:histidyl-tRNA synthetase
MNINKIRGTRDIINFENYIKLYQLLREELNNNNYNEIHTPYMEYEELLIKNLGSSTDIVNKEMYYISHANSNEFDKKIVLRPELTTAMMRAYLEEKIIDKPWKVFQIGAAFRHERPQKGRYREFFQCSIECINAESIGYDIELLILLNKIFKKLIIDDFELDINYIGNNLERKSYKEALYNYCISKKKLFPESIQNKLDISTILRILDSKDDLVKNILLEAPIISDFWTEENKKNWTIITQNLSNFKIKFNHNQRLIRGLDYYNGLIFEFISTKSLGTQSTFCGGGRYDGLANNIDIKSNIPSLGAGIGIDRLLLIIEENKKNNFCKNISLIAIIIETENQSQFFYSLSIQEILQNNKILCKIYFDKNTLKSGLKKANNENASICCIITDKQIINNTIIIKEMRNEKTQVELSFLDGINYIIKKNNEMIECVLSN